MYPDTSDMHQANKIASLSALQLPEIFVKVKGGQNYMKPVYMWQFEVPGKIILLLLSAHTVGFCYLPLINFHWTVNKQMWIIEILLNYVILCCVALQHKWIHKYLEGLNIRAPQCALASLSSSSLVSALLCFSKLESEQSQNQQGGWSIKRKGIQRGGDRRRGKRLDCRPMNVEL